MNRESDSDTVINVIGGFCLGALCAYFIMIMLFNDVYKDGWLDCREGKQSFVLDTVIKWKEPTSE